MLIVAIAYYQTEILGLSAKTAGKVLSEKLGIFNLKQKSIKSLVSKLQQDIDHLAENAANRMLKDEAERGTLEETDFDDSEDEGVRIFTDEELDNVEEDESDE